MFQILYGKNPIIEAVHAKRRKIHEVYLEGKRGKPNDSHLASQLQGHGVNFKVVEKKEIEGLTRGVKHQGIAAKVEPYPYLSLEELISQFSDSALFVMCDSIQDPQNLGAICRSAYCFGAHGIILNKDRSVEVTPAVSKASAGAVEYLSICRVTNLSRSLDQLKQKEFWTYAAVQDSETTLETLSPASKMVLVLGSEGTGIRRLVLESCDSTFTIPMEREFDSLNVAQAASVILYEISRKRHS